ncbi:MotE family protein [Roseivivax sediminis]|uniref:Flagellar motility protein MotE, a chaperone for MotC folding n=1 Tax=Roseivivax sediminis TaxID=936889 RepID=A0A1I1UEH3_9RHOB|nr:hypothetical protein [Roseivivax sediminis]SFD69231.1 Flagellar motility protein MotE, a chaperone for MotC folding [Roseivivax sediminis]
MTRILRHDGTGAARASARTSGRGARGPAGATKKTSKGRKPGRRRGTLALIGSLLVASAILRLGDDASRLVARAAEAQAKAPATAADGGGAEVTGDSGALLEALDAREARLDKRERDLLIRMQALRVAETEIEQRLTALEEAEASLRATLDLARSAATEDLNQLTEVYARMKPRQAAALFEEMDPNFAAGFLGRMRPENAAAIMAGLTPDAAYLISVMLAGRNADVPKASAPDDARADDPAGEGG